MEQHLLQLFTMRALHLPTQDEGHLAVAWIDIHARSARDDAPARARQVNTRGAGLPFGSERKPARCTDTHARTPCMHTAPSMCMGIDPRTHAHAEANIFLQYLQGRKQSIYLVTLSPPCCEERYTPHTGMWHRGRAAAHACDACARRERGCARRVPTRAMAMSARPSCPRAAAPRRRAPDTCPVNRAAQAIPFHSASLPARSTPSLFCPHARLINCPISITNSPWPLRGYKTARPL